MDTVYLTVDRCKHNGMTTITEDSTDYKMRFIDYTMSQAIEKAKSDIRSLLNAKRLQFIVIKL